MRPLRFLVDNFIVGICIVAVVRWQTCQNRVDRFTYKLVSMSVSDVGKYSDWVTYIDVCNFCAASGPETSELLEWLLFILTLSSKREMLWTLSLALVVTWIGVFLLIHLPNTTLIISQSEVLYCMWCCPIVWIRSQCLLAAGLHLSCWVLNSKSP